MGFYNLIAVPKWGNSQLLELILHGINSLAKHNLFCTIPLINACRINLYLTQNKTLRPIVTGKCSSTSLPCHRKRLTMVLVFSHLETNVLVLGQETIPAGTYNASVCLLGEKKIVDKINYAI